MSRGKYLSLEEARRTGQHTGNLPGIAPGQNRIPSDSELQTLYGSNASPDQLSQDYAQDFNIRAACD
jgi:hypothetical protein